MYKIINKKKLFATIVVDFLGRIIFYPINILRKKEEIKAGNINNILVIRTAYIGDVVMVLPLLKPLKEKFPAASITFLTSKNALPVLQNNPYIDEIITYDPFWFYPTQKRSYLKFIKNLRKYTFEMVIETRADIRELLFLVAPLKSKYKVSYNVGGGEYLLTHVVPYKNSRHKIEYHLGIAEYLDCNPQEINWGIYLTPQEKETVRSLMEKYGVNSPFVCVHPGSRIPLKRWGSEKCAVLYDRIIEEYNLKLVVFGTLQEKSFIDTIITKMSHQPINLTGKINLREMAAILTKSTLFICNDSAPMHIAAAMNTPTVAIFGPSNSKETGPFGSISQVVEKDFPCRSTCDENRCKHNIFNECLKSITPKDVFAAIRKILPQSVIGRIL